MIIDDWADTCKQIASLGLEIALLEHKRKELVQKQQQVLIDYSKRCEERKK